MIGQVPLVKLIHSSDWVTPRFTILSGGRGSGKRILASMMANKESIPLVDCGIKVDDVRDVINFSHKLGGGALFMFANADHMSHAARNALLKVTEEAPRQSKFLITVHDFNQVMPTLLSRGYIMQLAPYKPDELIEYACTLGAVNPQEQQIISEICQTPGDVDILFKTVPEDFYSYVNLVVDNLREVSPANALKIGKQMAFKPDDEGYDVVLFLRAFMILCNRRDRPGLDTLGAYEAIRNTTRFLGELNINGVNKSATFDMWLLDMMGVFGNDPTS